MARIAGINIPENKRIVIALTYIFGIGKSTSLNILKTAQINQGVRAKDLSEQEINKLRDIIEKNHTVEGDLKRRISLNVKRLKDINCYRGTRHIKGLPARGQRTKTNTRTVRGNVRKTAGSGRKAAAEKT